MYGFVSFFILRDGFLGLSVEYFIDEEKSLERLGWFRVFSSKRRSRNMSLG